MEFSGSQEFKLPPQALLQQVLQGMHQEAMITSMQEHGVPISSWDELRANIHNAEMDALVAIPEDLVHVAMDLDGGVGEAVASKPVYPIRMLGYSGLQLVSTAAPFEFHEHEDRHSDVGNIDYLIKAVEHPLRALTINLVKDEAPQASESVSSSGGIAVIFMCPDAPPQVVHGTDMKYVSNFGWLSNGYSMEVINDIEKAFGEDAVETLSAEQCIQLMQALSVATKSFDEA